MRVALTTTPAADEAMVRRSAERRSVRRSRLQLALLILLTIIVLALVAYIASSGAFDRLVGRPSANQEGAAAQPRFAFAYPKDTPEDRILMKTGASITLTHEDKAPDAITLGIPPGDLSGSFTWTFIPHQGSRVVKRLIGEAEWQGRVYKLCEAIDDQESDIQKYAERYFPINNAGDHYRLPMKLDYRPFLELLNGAIAQIPIGQQTVGDLPPPDIRALAQRVMLLCTGQTGPLK